jgi:hypothetical protein
MADRYVIEPAAGLGDQPPEPADVNGDHNSEQPGDWPSPATGQTPPVAEVLAFLQSQRKLAEQAADHELQQVENNRKRTDMWGKGVLGLGTALLTALGIGKLSDFLPQEGIGNQIMATAGLIAAIIAIGIIGVRLSRVSVPIVMRANENEMTRGENNPEGVDGRELKIVSQVYARFVTLNGCRSVAQYAAVATIIESTLTELADKGKSPGDADAAAEADSITDVLRKRLRHSVDAQDPSSTAPTEEMIRTYVTYTLQHPELALAKAAVVRSELRYVMTNALAEVVRRRAVNATADKLSWVILAVVPIGVALAVGMTFYAGTKDANRLSDWQDAKTCVDVAASINKGGLTIKPPDCEFPPPTLPSPSPTPSSTNGSPR